MKNEQKREERILIMSTLYRYDMEDTYKTCDPEEVTDYVRVIVDYVVLNKEKIDEIISKSLTNYTINRLSYVDRAICRMVVAELKNEVPAPVSINEALEIVKAYSDQGDNKNVRFMNKLLDTIKLNI